VTCALDIRVLPFSIKVAQGNHWGASTGAAHSVGYILKRRAMGKVRSNDCAVGRRAWSGAISTGLMVLWGLTAPGLGQEPARLPDAGPAWKTLNRNLSIGTPLDVSEAMVNEKYEIRVGYKLKNKSELTISLMDARAERLYVSTKFAGEQERRPSDGEPLLNCSKLTPGLYFVVFTVARGRPSETVQSFSVRSVKRGAKPQAGSNEARFLAGAFVTRQNPTGTTSAAEKLGETREKARGELDFSTAVSATAFEPDLITMMEVAPDEGDKFTIKYNLSRACKVFEEAREEDSDKQTWKTEEQNRLQGPCTVEWDATTAAMMSYKLLVHATASSDPDDQEHKIQFVRRK
jgi:hypothetical protein